MKAYKDLVKTALHHGFVVSVFDGEEWSTKKSNQYKVIIDDIEGVEEAQIVIRDASNKELGWALIIPSLEDDETVADFTITSFMNNWDLNYTQKGF